MALTATDIKEGAARREEQKAAIVKQNKVTRATKRANSGSHVVNREVHPTRIQEADDAHDLGLPTAKRYVRASSLPGIAAPPGYSVKWVRRDNRNRGDSANLMQHMREGWVIARKKMFKQQNLPTSRLADHGEIIGNDDTILMIATEEMVADRKHEIRDRTDRATKGVHEESGLRGAVTPQMPLVEDIQRSRPEFHRMRKRRDAKPADDDTDD